MSALRLLRLCLIALCAAAVSIAAGEPARWEVDEQRSAIEFSTVQAGAVIKGAFKRFDADIRFDASDLEHSAARVTISIDSLDSASKDRDDTLRSDAFFGLAQWPVAVFEVRSMRAVGNGFEADGQLTIRDQTRPVLFAFTVDESSPGQPLLRGQAKLKRLSFGLGQGEWQDTTWVADDVTVDVVVHAQVRPANSAD